MTCKTCKSPRTLLKKENRIFFMVCEACGSQRSVTTIKTGFQAQVRSGRVLSRRGQAAQLTPLRSLRLDGAARCAPRPKRPALSSRHIAPTSQHTDTHTYARAPLHCTIPTMASARQSSCGEMHGYRMGDCRSAGRWALLPHFSKCDSHGASLRMRSRMCWSSSSPWPASRR